MGRGKSQKTLALIDAAYDIVAIPHVGDIRWKLDQPEPTTRLALPKPARPTADRSRANLVAWWQWRYACLNAEYARLQDSELALAQTVAGLRPALHVSVEQQHQQRVRYDHLEDRHRRLLAEYRRLRESILSEHRRAA